MSYAPESTLFRTGDGSIRGMFRHRDTDATFEFSAASGTPFDGYDLLVWVGAGSSRYARVLKTVAYVVVDEDEHGQPVVEKWAIKAHQLYEAPAQ